MKQNSYGIYVGNLVGHETNKVTVVFDGYLEKGTKDPAHLQRYPVASMEMVVTADSKLQCDKDVFLSNKVNKQKFIDLLSYHYL